MADLPPRPDNGADARPSRPSASGTPRWVKVFALIALVVLIVLGVVALLRPGGHGPAMHGSSSGGDAQVVDVSEVQTLAGGAG